MNNQKDKNKKTEAPWWQPAVVMFTKMSAWVVAPVILAIFTGEYLDDRYGIEPWGTLGAVGAAFLISVYGIIKNAKQEFGRMEKKDNNSSKEVTDKTDNSNS